MEILQACITKGRIARDGSRNRARASRRVARRPAVTKSLYRQRHRSRQSCADGRRARWRQDRDILSPARSSTPPCWKLVVSSAAVAAPKSLTCRVDIGRRSESDGPAARLQSNVPSGLHHGGEQCRRDAAAHRGTGPRHANCMACCFTPTRYRPRARFRSM